VNAMINLGVPQNVGNILTSWEQVSFSGRTPLQEVSIGRTSQWVSLADSTVLIIRPHDARGFRIKQFSPKFSKTGSRNSKPNRPLGPIHKLKKIFWKLSRGTHENTHTHTHALRLSLAVVWLKR
jgi:hypothetical protein